MTYVNGHLWKISLTNPNLLHDKTTEVSYLAKPRYVLIDSGMPYFTNIQIIHIHNQSRPEFLSPLAAVWRMIGTNSNDRSKLPG